ncbi:polyhydroxyalkanoic acid system family protein [Endozoicomonas sp. SM1973]|uniref:Polyhydroxyalkanoic acid system family protein n=1 Tax=Spartinivicinus marinus TaxID=2994442 RepID=A0A853IBV5_9GAMM|nr:polyhydroxyalkanoic acid system family protein [Spartinivicinus marinus]MCX4027011.1 polyhydroxyalkanoic acid system family protein [Spartinivicinus marinus]NYZ67007.1 polyhydroxyalkanoic acid system family protein [Spartinivicinus marinus]
MSKINIQRDHGTSKDKAKDAVQKIAEELQQSMGATYEWQQDTLLFKQTGAKGKIVVDDQKVDISIELGLLMKPLKGTIEQQISQRLDKLIG